MSRFAITSLFRKSAVHQHRSLQAVSLFGVAKGLTVLVIGLGFAGLVWHGESAHDMAQWLVEHAHLQPEWRVTQAFLDWSNHVSLQGWLVFGGVLLVYVTIQFVEAYGLWFERRWAEWLCALSGSIYLPLEVVGLVRHPGWFSLGLICINMLIVGYMAWLLWRGKKRGKKHRLVQTDDEVG